MTTHDEEYRRLLRRSLIVTVSCILAVVICYFWVDRTVAIGLSAPMLLSLVAMNYHFVSDVIAGGVLGALIAAYAVHLARLKMA